MAIRLRGLSKSFGDLRAVDGVDLDLAEGEVLALLGENGAGKSTLMKLLYGVHQPDSGQIEIDGHAQAMSSPRTAIACGIGMVFQSFTLFPALTVLENLLLSRPRGPWITRIGRAEVLEHLTALAPGVDPGRRIGELSSGERQLVEIVRVLNARARCIILDEPTAVLTPAETERLYGLIRSLVQSGRSLVLITHKMADVQACADRVVVMRRGKIIDAAPLAQRTATQLVHAMVGESQDAVASPPPNTGAARLVVRNLTGNGVREISFEVSRGEILGFAGVAGNGQLALAETLANVVAPTDGSAELDGHSLLRDASEGGTDARVGYVPELPRENAVVESLSATINLALGRLASMPAFPDWPREQESARALMQRFDVRPAEPLQQAGAFSGGNLQKLVLARELADQPDVVIACYPTTGLDVAATHAVHRLLLELSGRGSCVLWFSEDLDELIALAHRIAVMRGGHIAGILQRESATRAALGALMSGSGVTNA